MKQFEDWNIGPEEKTFVLNLIELNDEYKKIIVKMEATLKEMRQVSLEFLKNASSKVKELSDNNKEIGKICNRSDPYRRNNFWNFHD